MTKNKIRVIFFHRKPRKQNFSVEILFEEIRKNFSDFIDPILSISKYESNGIWKRFYITIQAALRQKWGDINHVTGDVNFLVAFMKKKRTILTILDVGFMNHPNPIVRFILRIFWIVLPVNRAEVITTISQASKNEILKYVKCDPNKIKVVYVPISSNFKLSEKPFNKKCPVILQIGTKPNKNVDRLIESIKDVPCHLDIVGEISEETQRKLEEYNINYSNSFRIPEEEMIIKYQNCDIVAFMSTYEGFGMPIVEANMVGKPVITSNLLSMPEVAGDAAHLVNPFDIGDMRNGILKVIEDDVYRNKLIENGIQNFKRFDPQLIAKQIESIYYEIYSIK